MSFDAFLQSNASDLVYPNIRPSLDLNFAKTKTLDPRITFTRNSTGTYVGSDGLIKTAVANEPRFDYDPTTGRCLGLLIETSRTNLVTNSDQALFGTLTGITRVLNATTAPDGTQTASLLKEDNGNNTHRQEFSGTLQNRTFSIFVKPAGRTRFRIYGVNQNAFAAFSLTESGSVTAVNSATARIESYPNGWYRCSLASTVLDTNQFYFGPIDTAVTYPSTWASSYTGDGVSGVYVWGAQLEAGGYPTSYIPTSGSTVTRDADIANITGTNFSSWYSDTKEGTLYFDTTLKSEFEDVPNLMIVALSRGASNYFDGVVGLFGSGALRYFLTVRSDIPNTGWFWNIGNYSNFSINLSSRNKYAVGFKVGTSSSNFAINGTLIGSKDTTFINVSGLYFGTNGVSQTISRITYYPKRLPDSQLQLLTK